MREKRTNMQKFRSGSKGRLEGPQLIGKLLHRSHFIEMFLAFRNYKERLVYTDNASKTGKSCKDA